MSSLADRAYDEIRRRLSAGEFDARASLSEPTLARELNVSRTPIREAIRRLEAEGFLEQRPKLGTYLRRPERQELAELYDVRLLLEPAAAALAARNRSPEHLRAMSQHLETMRELSGQLTQQGIDQEAITPAHSAADRAFHQVILDAAGNRTLARMATDAGLLGRVFAGPKDLPVELLPNLQTAAREHQQVLRAITAGDAVTARRAMRAHLSRGRRRMLAYLEWIDRRGAR
jgi:DNA-binding GntR family transcriptional regulator